MPGGGAGSRGGGFAGGMLGSNMLKRRPGCAFFGPVVGKATLGVLSSFQIKAARNSIDTHLLGILSNLVIMRIKDDMVIWAKLTQGNGRGTCCWITHTSTNFFCIQPLGLN
jgi:hypothetical protein